MGSIVDGIHAAGQNPCSRKHLPRDHQRTRDVGPQCQTCSDIAAKKSTSAIRKWCMRAPYSHHFHFPLMVAPFFGIEIVAGGVILLTWEKFPWLMASVIRPRESIYRRGSPTGTSMKVLT